MFTKTFDRQNHETRHQPVQILYEYLNRIDIGRKFTRHLLPEIVNKAQSCITEKVTTHSFNGYSLYKKHMMNNYSEHLSCRTLWHLPWTKWSRLSLVIFSNPYETYQNDHNLVNACIHSFCVVLCCFICFIVICSISLNPTNDTIVLLMLIVCVLCWTWIFLWLGLLFILLPYYCLIGLLYICLVKWNAVLNNIWKLFQVALVKDNYWTYISHHFRAW